MIDENLMRALGMLPLACLLLAALLQIRKWRALAEDPFGFNEVPKERNHKVIGTCYTCGDDAHLILEDGKTYCFPCSYGVATDLDAENHLRQQRALFVVVLKRPTDVLRRVVCAVYASDNVEAERLALGKHTGWVTELIEVKRENALFKIFDSAWSKS